ncbi:DUF4176 domain-containing protein [Carnobacterium maltaromaticum]|uniref:DUF4176 domain-containing protein n=1 Tax=Carnobacterium maltaromaticum TaxID=2751 RepID=UPI00295E3708|nr:DUF4176 domain-containing protein [Carnobacterium maltaromaticum]
MGKDLHSLGTIVYLQEGTQKIMVVARGVVYNDETEEKEVYTDYMGCAFPEGIDPNNTLFFNHDNIDQVLFEGYDDDDNQRFLTIYEKWEKELEIPKKKID